MFCIKCGKEIAEGANFCTACGNPVNGNYERSQADVSTRKSTAFSDNTEIMMSANAPKKQNILKMLIGIIAGIIIVIAVIHLNNPDNNILGIKDMRECYKLSQEVIRDSIYTPDSAKFPRFDADFVTQQSEKIVFEGEAYNVHTVSAYVDYDNIFGVSMRANYVVEIGLPADKDSDVYYYDIIEFD